MDIRHATVKAPQISEHIGEVTIVADGDSIIGIYYPSHWTKPDRSAFGTGVDAASDPVIAVAATQLAEYLDGERTEFDVATRADGDEFDRRVWGMLRQIPYGQTTTYGAIAERMGDRNLAQRVGRAVGHNPLSIMVACHRVVGADGSLTGYAGGLERKRFLLELEGALEDAGPTLF